MTYEETFDSVYAKFMPDPAAGPVLDFGCGGGGLLRVLGERGFKDLHGIDPNGPEIARAKGLNPQASLETVADCERWVGERPGMFAAVIARQVLYYIPVDGRRACLEAIRRSLKPGGVFIVEVFNLASPSSWVVTNKDRAIETGFYDRTLEWALVDAGFNVVAVFGDPFRRATLRQTAFSCCQRLWQTALKTACILERGMDEENPRIYSKDVYLVGRAP
ncbi:MAG: methyltransferase domain-containing protein [Elusimicrobia bacterium]|nr:methyltransferase domain-containing protein [Elusimicrobiota bacterium]